LLAAFNINKIAYYRSQ